MAASWSVLRTTTILIIIINGVLPFTNVNFQGVISYFGWNSINLVVMNPNLIQYDFKSLMRNLSKNGVQMGLLRDIGGIKTNTNNVILSSTLSELEYILPKLKGHKHFSTLVITSLSLEICSPLLTGIKTTTSFFLSTNKGHQQINAIQTFMRKATFLSHEVSLSSNQPPFYKINFDFQGLTLHTVTLPWLPYCFLYNCSEETGLCEVDGTVVRVIQSLGNMYNFSLTAAKEPSGIWGVHPVEGSSWYDEEPVYRGVLKAVFDEISDIPLSIWAIDVSRGQKMENFQISMSTRVFLIQAKNILNVKSNEILSFTKPFSKLAWLVLGLFLPLLFLMLWLNNETMVPLASQITIMVSWFFFIAIHAYYAGALIMFFSSTLQLPFSTFAESLKAYPTWNSVSMQGHTKTTYSVYGSNEKLFEEGFKRAMTHTEYIGKDLKEVLEVKLRMPGTFYFVNKQNIMTELAVNHPGLKDNFVMIPADGRDIGTLALPRTSNLVPMFNEGIVRLRESGTLRKINEDFTNMAHAIGETEQVSAINIEQTSLIFICMGCAIALSWGVFLTELIFHFLGGKRVMWRRVAKARKK